MLSNNNVLDIDNNEKNEEIPGQWKIQILEKDVGKGCL